MEMKGTNNKADNWLLAKKPIGGNSCASCEAYIGDLWENREFIPWNKMPIRDPSDKVYRIGNGFSKMLNMLNVEQVNLNEVGTTTNNGKRNISTAKPGYRSNRLGNSYNKKTDLPPVNGERLKDLNLSADNLEVVEDSEYKNIEVGKKEPSM